MSVPPAPSTLDEADRAALLQLARRAISESFSGREPSLVAAERRPALERKAGAFVTLRRRATHELRGCVGYIEPVHPLWQTVAKAAVSAAIRDPRFPPVAAIELDALALDISVLGAPAPIRGEDVVVGRHGLVVERSGRRGLLLPQVPLEWGWDRVAFLEHACGKAGLSPSAWRDAETRLLAFTAEVFADDAPSHDAQRRDE